jgi:hypothetical protein
MFSTLSMYAFFFSSLPASYFAHPSVMCLISSKLVHNDNTKYLPSLLIRFYHLIVKLEYSGFAKIRAPSRYFATRYITSGMFTLRLLVLQKVLLPPASESTIPSSSAI